MFCSFCAHYDMSRLDTAKPVVVMNGQSTCLDHSHMLKDGDWLIQLSKIGPVL